MDYRLTDAYLDPPDMTDAFHTEKFVRLSALCCISRGCKGAAGKQAPRIGWEPHLSLLALNNPSKLNEKVIALWARILKAVPTARMMLGNAQAKQEKWLLDLFAKYGVGGERLLLQPRLKMNEYLALHHQVDLALDPFPYNGGTTTYHALWMGVPVVTLAGDRSISRAGASIVSAAGLPQFVAQNEEEYVECAIRMTQDLNGLDAIRQELREQMSRRDLARFTRELEEVYRDMWQVWCKQGR